MFHHPDLERPELSAELLFQAGGPSLALPDVVAAIDKVVYTVQKEYKYLARKTNNEKPRSELEDGEK